MKSYNCIVCAEEFDEADMQGVALSNINFTKFKICKNCLELSDPEDDYKSAKEIINSYLRPSSLDEIIEVFESQGVND